MNTQQLLDALTAVLSQYVDKNGLLYFKNKLDALFATKTEVSTKVDKIEGKQLSTNDYTNEEKSKLAGLQNYTLPQASSTTLGGIKVGAGLTIDGEGNLSATGGGTADAVEWENVIGKPTKVSQFANDSNYQTAENVNATLASYAKKTDLPTKVSDLTNDSGFITEVPDEYITDNELAAKGYQTASQVETAITKKGYQTASQVESIVTGKGYQTASQVQAMVNNAQHMKREIVEAIPEPSSANELTIYLVPNDKGSYDEYMLINGKMDKVGASDVDLTGYLNTTNFTPLSNSDIDSIFN